MSDHHNFELINFSWQTVFYLPFLSNQEISTDYDHTVYVHMASSFDIPNRICWVFNSFSKDSPATKFHVSTHACMHIYTHLSGGEVLSGDPRLIGYAGSLILFQRILLLLNSM